MGSGAEAAHETVEQPGRAAARRSACSRSASTGRSRSRTSSAALPSDRAARSPCSTAPRSRAPSASRSTSTWSPRCAEAQRRRHARRSPIDPLVIGGRYGLSSKEFTPAMVKAVFDELAQGHAEDPLHRRHRRRRDPPVARRCDPEFDIEPADVVRARLLRPRRRRHGRRQQELDQDHRRGDRQLRPGLLRVRLEEVRRDDDLAPALRAAARSARSYLDHAGRASSPATSSASSSSYDVLEYAGAGRRRSCSTRPTGTDEVWDAPARARCRSRSSRRS